MKALGTWSRSSADAFAGDRPVLCSCAVRISYPFALVKRQLLEGDARWMTDAYRAGAIAGGFTVGGRPAGGPREIRLQGEHPYLERGLFALPLRWEGAGTVPRVTGVLGVFRLGPTDVEIGLISLSPWPDRTEHCSERTRLERVMDAAMRSFLACVIKALASPPGGSEQ
jgi:hypothetical protein